MTTGDPGNRLLHRGRARTVDHEHGKREMSANRAVAGSVMMPTSRLRSDFLRLAPNIRDVQKLRGY
jgi:hypothetical protein